MTPAAAQTSYATVNGLSMYYEVHGDGQPLVLLHGGFGMTGMFGEVLPQLAAGRRVIAVDLQGHGRTADIDRPLSLEAMGDDVAALIRHLALGKADIMGYSMGGGAALRTAIQHPEVVRKLVVVSLPFKRNGWYPEVRAGMEQVNEAAAEFMKPSPMYQGYIAIAPKPENFPLLCAKMGEMVRRDYDWSAEVAAIGVGKEPSPTHVRTPEGFDLPLRGEELRADISRRFGSDVELMKLNHGIFDAATVSIITPATILAIEHQAGIKLDTRRFRPNIVLETYEDQPFHEDQWIGGTLVFGEVGSGAAVNVTIRDERCMMINLHPDTAQQDPTVMKAVVRMNQNNAGVYGTVLREGVISVGQRVQLLVQSNQ